MKLCSNACMKTMLCCFYVLLQTESMLQTGHGYKFLAVLMLQTGHDKFYETDITLTCLIKS
jgi:hypothetical protein